MSVLSEGPFAAKPRNVSGESLSSQFVREQKDAAPDAHFSDQRKTRWSHQEGPTKESENQEMSRDPVPSQRIHKSRETFTNPRSAELLENPTKKIMEKLLRDIVQQSEVLTQLSTFLEAHGYQAEDEEGLMLAVEKGLMRAKNLAEPYLENSDIRREASEEILQLEAIHTEFSNDIADVKEAIESLEHQGEITVPDTIKALFEISPSTSTAEHTGADPVALDDRIISDQGPSNASQDDWRMVWRQMREKPLEKIATVGDQLRRWKEMDQALRGFKDEARFKADLRARGLGNMYKQVLALTGRSAAIEARLEKIKKQVTEVGELDDRAAGFLTALFFDYQELLTVGARILAEREKETLQIVSEKESRVRARAQAKKKGHRTGDGDISLSAGGRREVAPEQEMSEYEPKPGDIWERQAAAGDPERIQRITVTEINKGRVSTRYLLENGAVGFGVYDTIDLFRRQLRTDQYTRAEQVATILNLDGKVLERDESGALLRTEWERLDPVEQQRVRRELFDRKDRFVAGLNERLKRAGASDIDRRKKIMEQLNLYLPAVIKLIVPVNLSPADITAILADLQKETVIT